MVKSYGEIGLMFGVWCLMFGVYEYKDFDCFKCKFILMSINIEIHLTQQLCSILAYPITFNTR